MGGSSMALRQGVRLSARVARVSRVQSRRLMSAEADQYQALTSKEAFFGSAHEQPKGSYTNKIHEQDELWWDDGTAVREPIFDSDFIPMGEAVPMFLAGFGLFAGVAATQYYVMDPSGTRPTVPRVMPDADIWEKPAGSPLALAAEAEAEE